jgi:hypothetical protein
MISAPSTRKPRKNLVSRHGRMLTPVEEAVGSCSFFTTTRRSVISHRGDSARSKLSSTLYPPEIEVAVALHNQLTTDGGMHDNLSDGCPLACNSNTTRPGLLRGCSLAVEDYTSTPDFGVRLAKPKFSIYYQPCEREDGYQPIVHQETN